MFARAQSGERFIFSQALRFLASETVVENDPRQKYDAQKI